MNSDYIKAILDHSPECIVLMGKNHEILAYNKVIQEVLRTYHGKNISVGDKYFPDFVVESLRELYLSAFNKAINGLPQVVQALTENERTSAWFEYTMSPVYNDNGELLGVTLSAKDIDIAKKAEIQIQSLSETLRVTLDSLEDSVTMLDVNYRILAMNKVAQNSFAKNARTPAAVGDDFRDFLTDRSHSFYTYFPKAVQGISSEVEMCYTSVEGRLLSYLTKFTPVYSEKGELTGVSIFAKDITEKKQFQSTLKEIAWQQSHLVRAPLARLMGIVNLMKEQKVEGQHAEIYHNYLLESARELDKIINDIELKTQI